jgi:predicted DNA-binding transcriptional regulator AlpA
MENIIVLQTDEFMAKQRQFLREELEKALKNVNPGKEHEEVLQTKDVCNLLKKSRQTIENWSDAGILNKRYLGDSVYYLRSEILASMREINTNRRSPKKGSDR